MINLQKETENILTLIFDNRESRVNLINESFLTHFETLVEEITRDDSTHGLIITSNKKDFLSGGDLEMFLQMPGPKEIYKLSNRLQEVLRKLEKWPKPVVAAINGSALGGGLELALACNYRVAINHGSLKFGLPEVNLGIMPGGGGTQRVIRTAGIEKGLPFVLQGKLVPPIAAKEMGLINELVDTKVELMEVAKAYIEQNPSAVQPWDKKIKQKDAYDPRTVAGQTFFSLSTAVLNDQFRGRGEGPLSIIKAIYEGSLLEIDAGCDIEARYFSSLFEKPATKNIIQTNFFGIQKCKNLRNDLTDAAPSIKSIGIIGAGIMGQGIAHVAAKLGVEVFLADNDITTAEMGKNQISKTLDKSIERGRMRAEQKQIILDQINTVSSFEEFKHCELVIECVFENRDIKIAVFENLEKVLPETTIIATNTSSLPLDLLGKNLKHPDRFVGLHFFSPVPRMDLVEVIKGPETKKEVLVRALKFTKELGKTPILVRDGLGFFTTRVFTRYITEAIALITEGYPPALVENAGKLLGFPVGPLEIADQVSLTLMKSLLEEKLKYLNSEDFVDQTERITLDLVTDFIENHQRTGRKDKKGFYDYDPEKGKSLSHTVKQLGDNEKNSEIDVCKDRLLYIQLIEALKCYEEGIINTAHEGDVASILGWGFPFSTGGIINLCHQQGNDNLLDKFIKLQSQWGERFTPPKILKSLINKNYETLHEARELLAEPFLEN